MSKIEYKGNWAIERVGKAAYRVVNVKVGLQFRAGYKKSPVLYQNHASGRTNGSKAKPC
jgi:hypothetical protein